MASKSEVEDRLSCTQSLTRMGIEHHSTKPSQRCAREGACKVAEQRLQLAWIGPMVTLTVAGMDWAGGFGCHSTHRATLLPSLSTVCAPTNRILHCPDCCSVVSV